MLKLNDKDAIRQDLFCVLSKAGCFVEAVEPADDGGIPGCQLAASA